MPTLAPQSAAADASSPPLECTGTLNKCSMFFRREAPPAAPPPLSLYGASGLVFAIPCTSEQFIIVVFQRLVLFLRKPIPFPTPVPTSTSTSTSWSFSY